MNSKSNSSSGKRKTRGASQPKYQEDPTEIHLERVLERLGAYSNPARFITCGMVLFLMLFAGCHMTYGQDKCFTYTDRMFYFLFFMRVSMFFLKIYQFICYVMKLHGREHEDRIHGRSQAELISR